jgi:hypothetical protein
MTGWQVAGSHCLGLSLSQVESMHYYAIEQHLSMYGIQDFM